MGTMHGMFFPSWRLCRVFEWFILESSIVFFPSMWGSEQRTRRPARHWQRSPCWDAQTSFEELSKGQKEATSTMTWLNWWHEMTWDDLKWYEMICVTWFHSNSIEFITSQSHVVSYDIYRIYVFYLSASVRSEKRLSATVAELTGARFCSRRGGHVESCRFVYFHLSSLGLTSPMAGGLKRLADLHYLSTAPSFVHSYHAQNDCLQAQQGHGRGEGSAWNCQ